MSQDYLLKTEPSEYSFADLQRDATTEWEGVSNPAAVKNLREMSPGARLIIYETGARKSAVGTATVVSVDASDPKNPKVKIKAGKAIAKPFARRNQGEQNVQGFAARPHGKALRRAAHERAVRVASGRCESEEIVRGTSSQALLIATDSASGAAIPRTARARRRARR